MKVVSNVATVDDEMIYEYEYYSLKFSVWDEGSNRNGWKITDTSVSYERSKYPLSSDLFLLNVQAGTETDTNYSITFNDDSTFEGEETLITVL